MNFEIAEHQINFFKEFGFIELEQAVDITLLAHWQKVLHTDVSTDSFDTMYRTGRDLYRRYPQLLVSLRKSPIPKFAAALTRQSKMRLLFDQMFVPCSPLQQRPSLFRRASSIEELSSFQDILIGVSLPLFTDPEYTPPVPFSSALGNIVFFNPQIPITWQEIGDQSSYPYLFFVFGTMRSRYIYNKKDPNTHLLKHIGYGFGDTLRGEDFPNFYFS